MVNRFKDFLVILLLLCVGKFSACSIVYNTALANDPCVKIESTNWLSSKVGYLLFCADATFVTSKKGARIPAPCEKKIAGYSAHRMYVKDSFVSWDGKEDVVDGDWIEFKMTPFTVNIPRPTELLVANLPGVSNVVTTTPKLEHFEGFDHKTVVETPFGAREIGTLRVGDSVVCRDFSKNSWTKTLVLAVNKTTSPVKMVKIITQDGIIHSGFDQNFYSILTQKWVKAQDLKAEEVLYKEPDESAEFGGANHSLIVQNVCQEDSKDKELVSLTLSDHYNFCVGGGGVLVHNSMFAVLCTVFNGIVCPVFQQLVTWAIVSHYAKKPGLESSICRNADFYNREVALAQTFYDPGIFGHAHIQSFNSNSELEIERTDKTTSRVAAVVAISAIGSGITFSVPPAAFTAAVVLTVGVILYKFAQAFLWSKESAQEHIKKAEEKWRDTFLGIENLKKQRAELYAQALEKAHKEVVQSTIARCQELVLEAQALSPERDREAKALVIQSELSEDERKNCMENNPEDKKQEQLDREFASMRIKYAPIILAAFEQEINDGERALERFKTYSDPGAANDMEKSILLAKTMPLKFPATVDEFCEKVRAFGEREILIDWAKNFVEEFFYKPPRDILECVVKVTKIIKIAPPITIRALAKISEPAKLLLSGSKPTEFLFPYAKGAGPAVIYKAIINIGDEKVWNIKVGDYFYSDHSHDGDHIEIFHGDGALNSTGQNISRMAKDVRSWDGTKHEDKKKQALGWKYVKEVSQWFFEKNKKSKWRHVNDIIKDQTDNKFGA